MGHIISAGTFIIGIIFGSFYGVIIYRLPMELPIFKKRSACLSCKRSLEILDLIPLFSYLALSGKCRYCKSKISFRYFIIELTSGLLFLISYLSFGWTIHALSMIVFWSMLLIVTVIDFDTMNIYDQVLLVFAVISLILLIIERGGQVKYNFYGAIVGFLLYALIYYVMKIIYKREAFGFGDVLLNTVIGLILGFPNICYQSIFAFFVALIGIGLLSFLGNKFKWKQDIPFGPYMCGTAFFISACGDIFLN